MWERRVGGVWYPCDERGVPFDRYLPYGIEPLKGNLRLRVKIVDDQGLFTFAVASSSADHDPGDEDRSE